MFETDPGNVQLHAFEATSQLLTQSLYPSYSDKQRHCHVPITPCPHPVIHRESEPKSMHAWPTSLVDESINRTYPLKGRPNAENPILTRSAIEC
jgi:hypothetical protein